MKTSLLNLFLAAVLSPMLAHANPELVGTWRTPAGDDQLALAGDITIREDGTATLAPEGFPALDGTWRAEGTQLTFTMPPHGDSMMDYVIQENRLTLTYNNGAQQTFERAPAQKDLK